MNFGRLLAAVGQERVLYLVRPCPYSEIGYI